MTVRSTRCGVRERRTKIELQVLELRLKKKKARRNFDGANVTE